MWMLAGLSVAYAVDVAVQPGDDVDALTSSLSAGDQIIFQGGVYELDGTLNWSGVGTQEEPIVLRGREGETPVLRMMGGSQIARLDGSEHVRIQGITFEGGDDWENQGYGGLDINGGQFISIEDCTIRQVGRTALRISGDTFGFTIEHNHIEQTSEGTGIHVGCGDASCWMSDSNIVDNQINDLGGGGWGIWLEDETQGVEVRDNVIYRTGGGGIFVGATLGPACQVHSNMISQAEDIGMLIEGKSWIHSNVVFNIGNYGIWSRPSGRVDQLEVWITNNTVVDSDNAALRIDDWFEAFDMVATNNALTNPLGTGFEYQDDMSGTSGGNYISSNVVTGNVSGVDPDSQPDWFRAGSGHADYLDVDNWNFYPSGISTLRNNGDGTDDARLPPADFNGNVRDALLPDVGAYEWGGANNPGWRLQENFKGEGSNFTGEPPGGCCSGKGDDPTEALFLLPLLLFGLRRRRED